MTSRIPGFYRFSPAVRLERVALASDLPAAYRESYQPGGGLPLDAASLMIENVIGMMSLPVGVGLNLLVNHKERLVPMVVEEPSVVAAVSNMARLTREAGGIFAEADPSIMIGQIQLLDVPEPAKAKALLLQEEAALVAEANTYVDRLVARGGGVRGIEVRDVIFEEDGEIEPMLVVHFHVDVLDAMGANLVNTTVERMAPRVAELTGGRVGLRILSNLADRRLVRASVVLPPALLAGNGFSGEQVVDAIVSADRFAFADPYRAATHNKGVMNGIDAVALATGNDWRAIEAGAHAFASRSGRYSPLTRWKRTPEGHLRGILELPLQVGVVGGPIQVHPTVRANLHIMGIENAKDLAEVMAAVGLAQNLGALRALATEGIQRGHMSMHARTVASNAGVPLEDVAEVVSRMIAAGAIRTDGALAAYEALRRERGQIQELQGVLSSGEASGKVILLGEHAVVHGYPALAGAIDLGVRVRCVRHVGPVWVEAPNLVTSGELFDGSQAPMKVALRRVFELLDAPHTDVAVHITGDLPPGKGLGSSAALAIASLRAVAAWLGRELTVDDQLRMGLLIEQVFHGMPSGIDHTVSVRGGVLRFRKGPPPVVESVKVARRIPIVLLDSGEVGPTSMQVGKVLALLQRDPERVGGILAEIGGLVESGTRALEQGDVQQLAAAMNRNHELLRELELSTPGVENLVTLATQSGAAAAKITGAGGGGMVLALCPSGTETLLAAAAERGISAFATFVPAGEL